AREARSGAVATTRLRTPPLPLPGLRAARRGAPLAPLLDRLSTPILHRYTRGELERWFTSSGLESVELHELGGWVASGRKPARAAATPPAPSPARPAPGARLKL